MVYCKKCGHKIEEGKRFCQKCGYKVGKGFRLNKNILMVGVVVLIVIISSVVFLTLIKNKPQLDMNTIVIDTLTNEIFKLDSKYKEIEFKYGEYKEIEFENKGKIVNRGTVDLQILRASDKKSLGSIVIIRHNSLELLEEEIDSIFTDIQVETIKHIKVAKYGNAYIWGSGNFIIKVISDDMLGDIHKKIVEDIISLYK